MKCLNCGATLTCGCQKRIASNGQSCCVSCVSSYENALVIKKNLVLTPIPNTI